MKKMRVKQLICVIVILIMTMGLVACSDTADGPDAGVYNAVSAEALGVSMGVDSVFPGGFTIELKDKGKCSITLGDDSASGKWEVTDGAFSISGGGLDCAGTLADGVMKLENVMDTGVTFILER